MSLVAATRRLPSRWPSSAYCGGSAASGAAWRRRPRCLARSQALASTAQAPPAARDTNSVKQHLLDVLRDTGRGSRASASQRGVVEEATLDVEACRRPFEYSLLAGRWRLIYTTATDVLPILALEDRLPGFQVTNIFQEFTAPGDDGVGSVSNIIQLTAPLVTEPPGLTLTVSAKYTVRSANRIALWFEEAEVGRFNVGPALQGLLAPAVLPRSPLAHQLLLALKEFTLRFPLSQTLQAAQRAAEGRPVGASYLISYLDEDMFIGRASIAGGLFIFSRDA